ncbi:clathrin heavy chain linker domain-containing protein 1-like [Amia ocellicauda]|uniref:clathrin heavy chain linker domain-containing protein 1-like n=1 Tax=Amia ocellicauda TaxID=2972642 RepID=UPI003463C8E4
MSGTGIPGGSPTSSFRGSPALPPIITPSNRDFLDTLYAYIDCEKKRLGCPEKGPDEQRYVIYSFVFEKVIEHVSAYKSVLSIIKKEYDDCIAAIKKSHRNARVRQNQLKVIAAEPTTLMHYQRRATQLWERTEIIQTNSAELRAQIEKLRDSRRRKSPSPKEEGPEVKPIGHIPGLTFEESISPEALTEHLEFLGGKRRELQHKKSSHYVPAQVKADLDRKMSRTLERRDELAEQNTRLRLRYKQIKVLSGAVLSWEKSDRKTPLLEFVSPILQQASDVKACDSYQSINSVGFEDDDPSKIKASELLADYMERFLELFDGGQYEAAAFHAARSPHGALRNMETMEKFRGITAYEGERPPLLMFFQALMISVDAVKNPPGDALSVEAVRCTLQHGCVELVTHWVTQHRLTYSEALADVIFEHGQRTPQISNTCLALAQMVYSECAVHRKAVLCMCRRGMISGALEFIYQSKTFTLDDCLSLLRGCPGMVLLQALTQEYRGRPAVLSVGLAALSLLSSDSKDFALQLLESVYARGRSVLAKTILEDLICSPEGWSEIAAQCRENNLTQLAQDIIGILSAQAGVVLLDPGSEDARLMEHVLL